MEERVFMGLNATNIITVGLVVLFWYVFLSLAWQAMRNWFGGA